MGSAVNVVIASYRRPSRLRTALTSVAAAAHHAPAGWSVGVTLVDDDPDGSAWAVFQEFETAFELGCTYVACGSQNISVARNAGLEAALSEADWVASIDDDVVVPERWFETCARAVSSGSHNAVTGPLTKDFSNGRQWLRREPFDQIGILTGVDGEDAFVCATGNYWMSAAFVREHPLLRFSPALGVTGGEDMDFFYRAVATGLRPVFSADAAVIEKEPAERCTLRYQVRRAFWLGISEAQINLRLGSASRSRLVARSARRAANRGARQLPADAVPRRGLRFSLAIWAQCFGVLLGCLGFRLRHK